MLWSIYRQDSMIIVMEIKSWTPSFKAYSEIVSFQPPDQSLVSVNSSWSFSIFSHTDNSCAKCFKLPSYLVASVFLLSNFDDRRMSLNKAFFSDNKNRRKKKSWAPHFICVFFPEECFIISVRDIKHCCLLIDFSFRCCSECRRIKGRREPSLYGCKSKNYRN